jgi:hypothetical protein
MRVADDGTTIIFRSTSEWFELERSGLKPNTIRLLDKAEYDLLTIADCRKVRIAHVDDAYPPFTRDITFAGRLDWVLGKVLYMVCWTARVEEK